MKHHIIETNDGSHSITIPEMNVTYHSIHGAVQESQHVFIDAGWNFLLSQSLSSIRILEMGFGTGLNALLTLAEAEKIKISVQYTALELFPLSAEITTTLNYCQQIKQPNLQPSFDLLHSSDWHKNIAISENFILCKKRSSLLTVDLVGAYFFNLIYFDAFAPSVQPELWTASIFERLFQCLAPMGILVTYCSKGDVRRAMKSAGFSVEKISGPPGKREMLRAIKAKQNN